MLLPVRISIFLGLAARCLAVKAVGDLFNVNFTTNDQGGCQYVGQTFMQNLVQDSYDLGRMGLQLVTDYSNNVAEARRLLDSFFQVQTPPMTASQLQAIHTAYTTVNNWIDNGGNYNGGTRSNKPYLFCYHSWLQRKAMSDTALDSNGEEFPNIYTGTPILINQIPEYIKTQRDESNLLPGNAQAYPYWSYKHNAYIFDGSYGSLSAGYCSNGGNAAATQHRLDPSSITICPKAGFGANAATNSASNLATIKYVGRGAVAPNPIPHANIGSATVPKNQQLNNVQPTASTMYHELFHLILGNTATYSAIGEVYDVVGRGPNVVGLAYDYAIMNPESFALAAVAYDYTVNQPANAAGARIEFFAGWTTQG